MSPIILTYPEPLLLNICIPVLVFISTHKILFTTSPNILYFVADVVVVHVTVVFVGVFAQSTIPIKSHVIFVASDQIYLLALYVHRLLNENHVK
jgi:asparagine N-glycosylation enzyme membrane subunit Stt3